MMISKIAWKKAMAVICSTALVGTAMCGLGHKVTYAEGTTSEFDENETENNGDEGTFPWNDEFTTTAPETTVVVTTKGNGDNWGEDIFTTAHQETTTEAEATTVPETTEKEVTTAEETKETESVTKPEETKETESVTKPEETKETESVTKPEETKETESVTKPEETKETESVTKPEETKETESVTTPEETKETESVTKPEETKETESVTKPEETKETESSGIQESTTVKNDTNTQTTTANGTSTVATTIATTTAKVETTIDGAAVYTGKRQATPVIKKAIKKKSAKKATIKIRKVIGVNGYQVKVSVNKKFKKKTTVTVASNKARIVVKKLKAGKKYFVKARTYTIVNGKKVYGKWSKVKKIKNK